MSQQRMMSLATLIVTFTGASYSWFTRHKMKKGEPRPAWATVLMVLAMMVGLGIFVRYS